MYLVFRTSMIHNKLFVVYKGTRDGGGSRQILKTLPNKETTQTLVIYFLTFVKGLNNETLICYTSSFILSLSLCIYKNEYISVTLVFEMHVRVYQANKRTNKFEAKKWQKKKIYKKRIECSALLNCPRFLRWKIFARQTKKKKTKSAFFHFELGISLLFTFVINFKCLHLFMWYTKRTKLNDHYGLIRAENLQPLTVKPCKNQSIECKPKETTTINEIEMLMKTSHWNEDEKSIE